MTSVVFCLQTNQQTDKRRQTPKNEAYLVLANILASGHWELSSIDVSIKSHTL